MILKNLVRYIINKYLKDYIEELDDEKLKLDLTNGHVCLERLHLKPESLADLNLPVTVATGYIEKLTLIIPWKNLYHRPTKVHIDGLLMLIVPKNEVLRDMTVYHDEKMRRVQRKVDNLRKAVLNNKKLDEKETTIFERMRLQMMRNLQINIRNLHISYETISTTKLGHPFSFGLTISYLEMTTSTNEHAIGRIKEHTLVIFKMKQIQGLSMYWNTKCQSRIDLSFDDVVNDLKCKIVDVNDVRSNDEMNYILNPMNLVLDLTITLHPGEFNFERPAYDIDIHIEELHLNIDPKQFSDLLDFIKFQNYSILYDRCQEYRTLQKQLISKNIELTTEQHERIQYLESKLDVFNLAYIRHSVEMEMDTYIPYQNHRRQSQQKSIRINSTSTTHHHKWYNSFMKTKTHSKGNERRKSSTSSSMTNNGDFFSEDSANIDIKIKVTKLALNLTFSKTSLINHTVLCPIQITDACISFKRRAVSSNILFIIDLQTLAIFGKQTDAQIRPLLATKDSISNLPVIHVELELAPLDKKSDYRLFLVIEPLKIIYDAATINQIVECFDPNNDQPESILPKIKHRLNEEKEHDLVQEKIFDLTMHLRKITLFLPRNGVLSNSNSMVHIDMENFILQSCLDDHQNHSSQLKFYRKYKLKIMNQQFIYSELDQTSSHILQPISLIEIDFYKCIYSDDAHLADWQMTVMIGPIIQIELSKKILEKLIQHAQSVPLIYSNMMETIYRINLYFAIFPPYTTLEIDLLLGKILLCLTQFHTSILINKISSHISKRRFYSVDMQASLNNLSMAWQYHWLIKQQSTHLFYRNPLINLIYQHSENQEETYL